MRSPGPVRTAALLVLAGLLALPLGWVAAHARYHSWHPCDWLLQDAVTRVLRRAGVDPDTASVPLKARTVESPYVQAVLRLRSTPGQCLGTWVGWRILP